jgi:hypothetical protein
MCFCVPFVHKRTNGQLHFYIYRYVTVEILELLFLIYGVLTLPSALNRAEYWKTLLNSCSISHYCITAVGI